MLFSYRDPRVFLSALLAVIWITHSALFSYWGGDQKVVSFGHDGLPLSQMVEELSPALSKEEFVALAVSTSIDRPYNESALVSLCSEVKWDSKLVFECFYVTGGIGNVRQELLTCLRYAIDAGAALLMPQIVKRDESDLFAINTQVYTGLDYLFDEDMFIRRLNSGCPQMRIFRNQEELQALGIINKTAGIWPRIMPDTGHPHFSVKSRIEELRAPPDQITLVPFPISIALYPVCHDPDMLINNFGGLLLFRQDTERLAAAAIYSMSERFQLKLKPSDGIFKSAYQGVHLRTAADAMKMKWFTYAQQAAHYLNITQQLGLPVIYVSSGNETSTLLLAAEAAAMTPPATVVTKYSLLDGAELEELKSMAWDQQALVDYSIISRSSFFSGMSASSFSWNLAVRRRAVGQRGTCYGVRDRWWRNDMQLPEGSNYRDELSDVMGEGMSPWEECTWP